jgi:hypothetical protein
LYIQLVRPSLLLLLRQPPNRFQCILCLFSFLDSWSTIAHYNHWIGIALYSYLLLASTALFDSSNHLDLLIQLHGSLHGGMEHCLSHLYQPCPEGVAEHGRCWWILKQLLHSDSTTGKAFRFFLTRQFL